MWNIKNYKEWNKLDKNEEVRHLCLKGQVLVVLSNLSGLPNLETIDLSHAHGLLLGCAIENLKFLKTLDISHYLKRIPVYSSSLQICKFPNSLTYLNLSYTALSAVGRCIDFEHLYNLHTLNLSHTGIEFFPKCPVSLQVLDVSSNSIKRSCFYFSNSQIAVIAKLKTLVIHGNIGISIPKEIPLCILLF